MEELSLLTDDLSIDTRNKIAKEMDELLYM
jgi:hypothetical protein